MTTRKKDWFPFHVDDYLADTNRFTPLQHGAYLLLLCEYWREEGQIRNDPEELRNITQIDKRMYDKVMPKVLKKFDIDAETLHHRQLDYELARHRKGKNNERKEEMLDPG